ncbi:RICIN domain-containing protein [Kitasatospora sp. NPDC058048]|uniref:RICIN domain-containing protein n=1 Tax=Kitasatospora sp. NPDC058048 TaxID=3346313 RepID=UPI0036DF0858
MNLRIGKGTAALVAGIAITTGFAGAPTAGAATAPALSAGERTFVNVNSGKCLEIWGDATGNGARAGQWDCNGSATQQWRLSYNGVWATIVNVNSGKCLEIWGDATNDGARAGQWDCNGSETQQWYWYSTGELGNANSGKCLEIWGDATHNGAVAGQWQCNGSATQKWR